MTDGPAAGLDALDEVDGLDRYHLFHAARAEMLLRLGDDEGATVAFGRALALAIAPAERRHLERRIATSSPT